MLSERAHEHTRGHRRKNAGNVKLLGQEKRAPGDQRGECDLDQVVVDLASENADHRSGCRTHGNASQRGLGEGPERERDDLPRPVQLDELGRIDWVTQACEELRARPVSGQSPEDAWTRLKDVRGLRPRPRAVAQSIAAWRKLRSLHMKEGNWKKALEAHERVGKFSDPGDPKNVFDLRVGTGIQYEIAVDRLRSGKPREAIAILRRLLKEQKQFIPAHVKLGEALREQGQESEAIQVWYDGFAATNSPIFLTTLVEHHLQREQPLAAIEALKHCISKASKDTVPRFYLGKLYFRLEMLDDAFVVLTALQERATYAPTLHYLLGRIHERRGNQRDAAIEYLQSH